MKKKKKKKNEFVEVELWNLWKCKTFTPADQIARNKYNDEKLELLANMKNT